MSPVCRIVILLTVLVASWDADLPSPSNTLRLTSPQFGHSRGSGPITLHYIEERLW